MCVGGGVHVDDGGGSAGSCIEARGDDGDDNTGIPDRRSSLPGGAASPSTLSRIAERHRPLVAEILGHLAAAPADILPLGALASQSMAAWMRSALGSVAVGFLGSASRTPSRIRPLVTPFLPTFVVLVSPFYASPS